MDELVLRIVFVLAALFCGGVAGWFSCAQIQRNRLRDIQTRASEITETARQDAEAMKKTALLEARDEWRQEYEPLEKEL
ncbi:MAG: Rnase Y domain-containing protein, partial [Candidatus Latescibacterota bacterium]|nr:Rnase Y domain-containing protein [Candidatus Latescibacterota bacterium]